MKDFLSSMDKIYDIMFIVSIVFCVVIVAFMFISSRLKYKKRRIKINKDRVISND